MDALPVFPSDNEEEARVRTLTRRCSEKHLTPFLNEDDEAEFFRRDYFEAVAEHRLHSWLLSRDWDGGGGSYGAYLTFIEETARQSVAMSISIGVTNLVQGAIARFGTDEQKRTFLKPLARGEFLGAFSLSEPQAGSDAAALRLAARKEKGGYRLSGSKVWCSNAGHADLYLVMARTGEHRTRGISTFLVPKDSTGFHIGKKEKKLGLRSSSLAELVFEDCFIPEEQRLAQEGDGFTIALSQLDIGRLAIATTSLGATRMAIASAWTAAGLDDALRGEFAMAFAHYQAKYTLLKTAIKMKEAGENISLIASQLKLVCSELAMQTAGLALEVNDYQGIQAPNAMERRFRDVKSLQIVEGTNQIQKLVIARELNSALGLSP